MAVRVLLGIMVPQQRTWLCRGLRHGEMVDWCSMAEVMRHQSLPAAGCVLLAAVSFTVRTRSREQKLSVENSQPGQRRSEENAVCSQPSKARERNHMPKMRAGERGLCYRVEAMGERPGRQFRESAGFLC